MKQLNLFNLCMEFFLFFFFNLLSHIVSTFYIINTIKICCCAYVYVCWTLRCDNIFPCIVCWPLNVWFQAAVIIVLICLDSNHSCKFLGYPMCSNSSNRNKFPCCPFYNYSYHIYDQCNSRMRYIYNLRYFWMYLYRFLNWNMHYAKFKKQKSKQKIVNY